MPRLCPFTVLMLTVFASLLSISNSSRPHPVMFQEDVASPVAREQSQDMSRMSCAEAHLHVMDIERRFSTAPLDLEKVCLSLKGALKNGLPKCPNFKPAGSFGKIFKVCKVVTNDGSLTCTSAHDCGTTI